MPDPFIPPSPIHQCACMMCTRPNDVMRNEPETPFAMYQLVRVEGNGRYEPASPTEIQQISQSHPGAMENGYNVKDLPWHKACLRIVRTLSRDKDAKIFKQPVDTAIYTDYLYYVPHPMDLGTIETRLMNEPCDYTNPDDVIADLRLVFYNCSLYNPIGTVRDQGAGLSVKLEKEIALLNFQGK